LVRKREEPYLIALLGEALHQMRRSLARKEEADEQNRKLAEEHDCGCRSGRGASWLPPER
jgi:hypothetical protein